MKLFGLMMLPLSVLPFLAVRGDVIREHEAYLVARNPRGPLAAQPGLPLPGHAPAPPLESPVRPVISLGRGANITLGTRDGSVLIELNREATSDGRRILADVNGDGWADIAVAADAAGVKVVACQVSVQSLAAAGSGRRADGGTAVHLPGATLGTSPRFVVRRGHSSDTRCTGPSFARQPTIALPGGSS